MPALVIILEKKDYDKFKLLQKQYKHENEEDTFKLLIKNAIEGNKNATR